MCAVVQPARSPVLWQPARECLCKVNAAAVPQTNAEDTRRLLLLTASGASHQVLPCLVRGRCSRPQAGEARRQLGQDHLLTILCSALHSQLPPQTQGLPLHMTVMKPPCLCLLHRPHCSLHRLTMQALTARKSVEVFNARHVLPCKRWINEKRVMC